MKRISYTKNNNPNLYVLATPIGNLDEINTRFIECLNKTNTILCEDTRVSLKLINYLNIKDKKIISYHQHNEYDKLNETIELIKKEHNVALLSDAGYPLLSDPGFYLVKECIVNDINIIVVNGSNALIPALINSGMPLIPFTFIGFLPKKTNDALKTLLQYQNYHHTLVLYESIHNINKTLVIINKVFGNVNLSISRELTKLNEEHIYARVNELILEDLSFKGELVVCIDNSIINEEIVINDEIILKEVNDLLIANISKKDAIKQVSKRLGIEKNYVYDLVHHK
ncbi:MAG: 16S rRNA (cytidine(1402)-2'-O)-methyltransferase [Bacilli bacterium]|jgi:16S rRNA (cytidine1402-2'-O)-methyltransferase|nr:16S rRNA (cytidine(1402)-2'-O)-methyltransferase [Bacilli bacterium]